MPDDVRPLFIISLPRSGSTLLQRMIARSELVATSAEPWFLLPLLEHFIADDAPANDRYDGSTARVAIEEFTDRLDSGSRTVEAAVREFAVRLYSSAASDGATYFLDKTPRYAAYLDEIYGVFPDAKYILLQRDAREVISSIIRAWGLGHWNVFMYLIDLVDGYDRAAALAAAAPENVLVVDFADLVADTPSAARRIGAFLDVPLDGSLIPADADELRGSVGDRSSAGRQSNEVVRPASQWDDDFQGLLRRIWLRRYLAQRERAGSPAPAPLPLRGARLYDRPSDLILVPCGFVWPYLNRWTGYRLEGIVRARLSKVVRERRDASPSRGPTGGRSRNWPDRFGVRQTPGRTGTPSMMPARGHPSRSHAR